MSYRFRAELDKVRVYSQINDLSIKSGLGNDGKVVFSMHGSAEDVRERLEKGKLVKEELVMRGC